jgi:hypothetical protein
VIEEGPEVRTGFLIAISQGEDLVNLMEGELHGLRLDDEAQALAVGDTVLEISRRGSSRSRQEADLLVIADRRGVEVHISGTFADVQGNECFTLHGGK